MKRLAMAGACAAVLMACGQGEPATPAKASGTVDDARFEVLATDKVRATLREPDSAKFDGTYVSTKGGARVLCGYVNSRNGMGGMSGRQRFVAAGVTAVEDQMAAGEMDSLWKLAC